MTKHNRKGKRKRKGMKRALSTNNGPQQPAPSEDLPSAKMSKKRKKNKKQKMKYKLKKKLHKKTPQPKQPIFVTTTCRWVW